jgi:hypothetical protein
VAIGLDEAQLDKSTITRPHDARPKGPVPGNGYLQAGRLANFRELTGGRLKAFPARATTSGGREVPGSSPGKHKCRSSRPLFQPLLDLFGHLELERPNMDVGYERTQHGRWHLILLAAASGMLVGAWLARDELTVAVLLPVIAAIFVLLALMFGSLTIRDEAEWLVLRYGPLPVFRKKIRYLDITSVEPGRISIIDGWGIHYIPGRGWTYNLWGFGCVKLTVGRKIVRVGTDDANNLAGFLRDKLAQD